MGDTAEKAVKTSRWKRIKAEFKKIIWPDKPTVFKKTVAVVVLSIILGVIIALLDTVFQYGINFLIGL
ncbi:MAG: preprotein translocase subunit SecE [Clostridiales bacterium]|nr:preprotein translocase subunit SecE [Clostridiales bacterium]MDY3747964.1 preprotein translocase subunit SecE [Lachnospiraceae bacterium]